MYWGCNRGVKVPQLLPLTFLSILSLGLLVSSSRFTLQLARNVGSMLQLCFVRKLKVRKSVDPPAVGQVSFVHRTRLPSREFQLEAAGCEHCEVPY